MLLDKKFQNPYIINKKLEDECRGLLQRISKEQSKFSALFDVVPSGVSIATDSSCKEILHNPAAAKFLRIKPWESLSHSALPAPAIKISHGGKLLSPEEMPIQYSAWHGVEVTNFKMDFIWEDGVKKTAVWNSHPLFDDKGNINGVIASFVEVAQQSKVEEELDLFFNFSLDAFMIMDYDGNIRQANSVFSEQLGYDKKKMLSDSITSHILNKIHPDDVMEAFCGFKKVVSGHPLGIAELRLRSKKGKYRWYSWTARPIPEKGLIYATARDITDKKKIEEELKNSHDETNNILESISDSFFALDNRWRFTYINKGAELQLSRRREELIGRDSRDFFHSTEMMSCFDRTMTLKESAHYEAYMNGIKKWLEVHQYPANKGMCVYFRDITESKNLKREMERLDRLNLIGQMAAGIGHEIRNPMTTVRGFLQMLGAKDENEQNKQYFSLMIEELDRANSIISEYLSLAKDKTIDLKENNLNSIINSLFPLLQADAMLNNKYILSDLGNIPDILLDEKEIRQLILNLARNGLEAMESGGELTIRSFSDAKHVVLEVCDQGNGIDPKIMDKIGTPFFTTKNEGTGLGLAVCYSIVSRHKATMDIDSTSRGTAFYVRFPQKFKKNKTL